MSQAATQLSSAEPVRVMVDGEVPGADGLRHPALINYGHFTSMQVRGGRVRGLALHLDRIARSHRELFATALDTEAMREYMRLAIARMPDCYLRTVFFEAEPDRASVMTIQRPPVSASTEPVALMPVDYQRPVPHVKHVGTFCKIYQAVLAERAGFDDALHTTADGWISETTGANIGFFDGRRIVWPARPSLPGVTRRLLEVALHGQGVESVREPVNLHDVPAFSTSFLTNSIGVAPVGRIGAEVLGDPGPVVDLLTGLYEAIPWDEI
jgi:branched-subunit amino acid aminotransferase/4-amino-4-deoxychorismate lyase